MTLQKIADAVGVNVATAQRAIVNHPDFANANSEIVNERGQLRPMHYAARDVELFHLEKLPGDDGKYRPMHSVAGDLISEIGIENARARVGEPLGTIVPKFSSPRVRGRAVTPCQNAAHSPHGWPCAAIACVFDW